VTFNIEARDVRCIVGMQQTFQAVGVLVRNGKRTDCPLCKGYSRLTLAYTDSFWHCHRCCKGGDVFTLVQEVEGCGFKDALGILARVAGVAPGRLNAEVIQAGRKKRKRAESIAAKWDAAERGLRLKYRGALHRLDKTHHLTSEALARVIQNPSLESPGSEEALWEKLQATVNLRERVSAAYSLLSFGSLKDRARFLTRPEERKALVGHVLDRGFLRTDDGKAVEVSL
jgi:hypothetical protein